MLFEENLTAVRTIVASVTAGLAGTLVYHFLKKVGYTYCFSIYHTAYFDQKNVFYDMINCSCCHSREHWIQMVMGSQVDPKKISAM